jgi:hypothetical protein
VDYNDTRPHSGLAGRTPREFAQRQHESRALHLTTTN